MTTSETKPDNFYVGYFPKAPVSLIRFLRVTILAIFTLMAVVSILVLYNQEEFVPSTFEYGTYTELSGRLSARPYPMLTVSSSGDEHFQSLLLVNFGKRGVFEIIQNLEKELGDLEDFQFTLKGTLIYYNGKTALEMTDGRQSVMGWARKAQNRKKEIKKLGQKTLIGEIVDPKCYLGVMKPAMGKVHQSCARRCISGGIPPVLVVENARGEANYLLITDPQGNPLHDELNEFIGPRINISGEIEQVDDWLVIKTDPASQIHSEFSFAGQIGELLVYLSPKASERCLVHPSNSISVCL